MHPRVSEIPPMEAESQDDAIRMLEVKTNQLKLDYDKYFLGTRPTEPAMLRAEVQKLYVKWSNTRLTNTALRYKFSSLNGRYQSFKRRWDDTLRRIEAGSYQRHIFKADLHDRERGIGVDTQPGGTGKSAQPTSSAAPEELFETYRDALIATGQDTSKISPAKLQSAIRKQEAAMKKKLGCERVDFKVVVTNGKVKLKAAAV